jgi:microcystin-dependent protein
MPFAGEIRLFAGNVAPGGWAFCHGQLASIASVPALFEALGTRYGGEGRTTFALPDLRGRVPLHRSSTIALGAEGGAEVVVLEANEIPGHRHSILVGRSPAVEGQPAATTIAGTAVPQLAQTRPAVPSRSARRRRLVPATRTPTFNRSCV